MSDFDSSRALAYPGTPGPGYQDAAGSQPADNLVWAILAVFCFWPLGVASVVNAAKVNGLWANGDVEGARAASRKAKRYAIWSAAVAGACVCVGVGLTVLAIMSPAPGS
ncbi:MAG TPA: CD225/dispanin family protein [Dermatophilaceae bacterium]|jgi:hypothetical protein